MHTHAHTYTHAPVIALTTCMNTFLEVPPTIEVPTSAKGEWQKGVFREKLYVHRLLWYQAN